MSSEISSTLSEPIMNHPKLVFLCGGNGSQILYPWGGHVDVTVISPTSDSGGSSGEFVREHGIIPPGDMRRALLVGIPSSRQRPIRRLFESRFETGCLKGHTVGNVIFLDCLKRIPDPNRALDELARIFGTHSNWHVRPATLSPISLHTTLSDGGKTASEGELDQRKDLAHVTKAWIEPDHIQGNPEAISAIMDADLVVLGPTDHVTSLISILLVKDIANALLSTKAKVVYVANLMTKLNETYGYTLADYLRDIERYAGRIIDDVIVNTGTVPMELQKRYHEMGQHLVHADGEVELWGSPNLWTKDLLMHGQSDGEKQFVRHDPYKTMEILVQILPKLQKFLYVPST